MKEPNHSIKILTKFDVNRLTKLKRGQSIENLRLVKRAEKAMELPINIVVIVKKIS